VFFKQESQSQCLSLDVGCDSQADSCSSYYVWISFSFSMALIVCGAPSNLVRSFGIGHLPLGSQPGLESSGGGADVERSAFRWMQGFTVCFKTARNAARFSGKPLPATGLMLLGSGTQSSHGQQGGTKCPSSKNLFFCG
jgi:hypothetical protein